MRLRQAALEDAEAIAPLLSELGYPTDGAETRRRLERVLAAGRHRFLVAEVDGGLVGITGLTWTDSVTRDRPMGRLLDVVVAERARGRGIGRWLVEAALAIAREEGWEGVELTTNSRRAGAHAFYEAVGFERTSIKYQIRF